MSYAGHTDKIIDNITEYLISNDHGVDSLYLKYFQVYSAEFLDDNDHISAKILNDTIKEAILTKNYENISKILEMIHSFVKKMQESTSLNSLPLRKSFTFGSFFTEYLETIKTNLEPYINFEDPMNFEFNVVNSQKERQTDETMEISDLYGLFPDSSSNFIINLSLHDNHPFELFKQLSFALLEYNKSNVIIFIDLFFCFEAIKPNEFTQPFQYIEAFNDILKSMRKKKVTIQIYNFEFVFQRGEFLHSNFSEKIFDCLPSTILILIDLRKRIEQIILCFSQDFDEEKIRLRYFLSIFLEIQTYIEGILKKKENLEIPDHSHTNACHSINSSFLRVHSINNPNKNFLWVDMFSENKPMLNFGFLFVQNWRNDNSWVKRTTNESYCFIYITNKYICLLKSRSAGSTLKLLNNNFLNDKNEENTYLSPLIGTPYLNIISAHMNAQLFDSFYFTSYKGKYSPFERYSKLPGMVCRPGSPDHLISIKFSDIRLKPLKQHFHPVNIKFKNCTIFPFDKNAEVVQFIHQNMMKDDERNSIKLENCVSQYSMSICESSFQNVEIFNCIFGPEVSLKKFPSLLCFKLNGECKTEYKISGLTLIRDNREQNEFIDAVIDYSFEEKKLLIGSFCLHSPFKFNFENFKIEMNDVSFIGNRKQIYKVKKQKVLQEDIDSKQDLYEFDFKFISELEVYDSAGTILVSNLCKDDRFHLTLTKKSDLKINRQFVELNSVKLMIGSKKYAIDSFQGSCQEFEEKFSVSI